MRRHDMKANPNRILHALGLTCISGMHEWNEELQVSLSGSSCCWPIKSRELEMCSMMEGNSFCQLIHQSGKPIVSDGRGAWSFKRTFRIHGISGKGLLSDPSGTDEELLEKNSSQYTDMKLMRGLWTEQSGACSGTFFPFAAPAGRGVLWCSSGHCLLPGSQRNWRCGYGTEVLQSGPTCQTSVRAVLDLRWLVSGCHARELVEHVPSHPTEPIYGAGEALPDFGFMMTEMQEGAPRQIFIPSPRQLLIDEPVCVLGFAHCLTAEWARTYLRTEADYIQAAKEAELRGHAPPPPDRRLDENRAMRRALSLQDDVCYTSRLVASPGMVRGVSRRIVEHTCSTFPGMSGGPGVDIEKPWQLLFVHTHADSDSQRCNYGYSVHHPLFVKAYEREVLPRLLETSTGLVSTEMLLCLHGWLTVNKDQLADQSVLSQVEQRCHL